MAVSVWGPETPNPRDAREQLEDDWTQSQTISSAAFTVTEIICDEQQIYDRHHVNVSGSGTKAAFDILY